MSEDDTPVILLSRDPSHGNEFRIGFDPRGTGVCDMQDLPDLPDEYTDYWYFCEEGSFVYPGKVVEFMKLLENAGIRCLAND